MSTFYEVELWCEGCGTAAEILDRLQSEGCEYRPEILKDHRGEATLFGDMTLRGQEPSEAHAEILDLFPGGKVWSHWRLVEGWDEQFGPGDRLDDDDSE